MRSAVLVWWLMAVAACGSAPPPPMPSAASTTPASAGDDRFPIAARPACTDEVRRAFADPDPAAIARAGAAGAAFTCGEIPEDVPLLDRAIFNRDAVRVIAMLEAGADPNARWSTRGDRLPIQDVLECALFGYAGCDPDGRILTALLQHGADPNARWCPFESRGHDGDPFPSCRSSTAWTPLMAAATFDQVGAIYRLLDAGADPWAANDRGDRALDMATSVPAFTLLQSAMFPGDAAPGARAWQYLREREFSRWLRDPQLQTPLARLVSFAVTPSIPEPPPPPPIESPGTPIPRPPRRPLLFGVDLERRRTDGRAALAGVLIDLGADPNERLAGRSDWTPLALALSGNQHDIATTLLARGADANARVCFTHPAGWLSADPRWSDGCTRETGTTPLMLAATQAAVDTMRLLLQHGAEPAARDWRGRTALEFAPAASRRDIARALGWPAPR